ncbi:MAG: hypothetical protein ABJC04_06725 [Verrucomicrobiota bacterium]
MKKRIKKITAKQFDKLFDEGKEDILQYCDLTKAKLVKPLPSDMMKTVILSDDAYELLTSNKRHAEESLSSVVLRFVPLTKAAKVKQPKKSRAKREG